MKVVTDKLANLYWDKFNDSSLPIRTRLEYLFKLKGVKYGSIVTAVGIVISAIIASITGFIGSTVSTVSKCE